MAKSPGSPTKYRAEMCAITLDLLDEGASICEVARELRVHRDTIYEWGKVHADFSDTLKMGRCWSQGKWEKDGRVNLYNKDFNATLWAINMNNRFPKDWRNRREQLIEQNLNVVATEVQDVIDARKSYEATFKKDV